MKLVIVSQYFVPEMGAAASRLYELAKGMIQRGCDVKVLAAMPNYPTGRIFKKYKNKFFARENISGIDVRRYWLYASNSNRIIPRIINMGSFALSILFSIPFLRKEKPDYLIIESHPLLVGFSGYLLSKACGAKFVLNVADLWPLSALELDAIKKGYFYSKLEKLEKFIYGKADLCLGQSDEIVSHLRSKGARRVHLFRNGVDLTRFSDIIENHKNGYPNKKIIYAGLIGVAQGLLNLCRNLDLSDKNAELHIYGDGAERNELVNYVKENPGKNIFVHHPVNRDDIPQLLSSYDAALIPLVKNIYGAVPSKIYESMAAGLPILYSGNGEGANIIKTQDVGWVSKPGNYKSLEENIRKLTGDIKTAREKGKKGKEAAYMQYNRDFQIDELYKLLKSWHS